MLEVEEVKLVQLEGLARPACLPAMATPERCERQMSLASTKENHLHYVVRERF